MTSETNLDSMTYSEAMALQEALRKRFRGLPGVRGPKVKTDYASWDWGKKNKELAAEHGVCYATVCNTRRRLGKARVPGGKHYPACLGWDWEKCDTDIARENKLIVGTVQNWRHKLGKPPVKAEHQRYHGKTPGKPVLDFSSVDWDQPDISIARKMGCSREYARQKRAEAGQPKRFVYELNYERFAAMFQGEKQLGYGHVLEKFGKIAHETFKRYCGRAGIGIIWGKQTGHPVYPWDQINFELPNVLISKIWGPASGHVANYRGNHPELMWKSKFVCWGGRVPDEFKALVAVEEEKAKRWEASQGNDF